MADGVQSGSFSGAHAGSASASFSSAGGSIGISVHPAPAPCPTPAGAARGGASSVRSEPQNSFWSSVGQTIGNIFDGAVYGGYSDNDSGAAISGQILTGLIPVVGQAADARDTTAAYEKYEKGEKGSTLGLALAVAGWIPVVGDWLKSAGGKLGRKAVPVLEQAGGVMSRGAGWLEKKAGEAYEAAAEGLSGLKDKWFYKPVVEATDYLPAGEGQTDAFGNVLISSLGSKTEQELVYHHEMVHQFLSPKFMPLREFRASARMSAYQNSSLCRYVEEALAETYAQVRVNGLSGVPTGLKFPIANGYVELKDVVTEAAAGTAVVGGVSYGVYLTLDTDQIRSDSAGS